MTFSEVNPPGWAPFRRMFDRAANPRDAQNALYLQPGVHVEKWDADLDALAALSGTNTIYYRSGDSAWSPVVIGSGLSFSGGTLTNTGGSGGGGAPVGAQYITSAADATLTAERVLTNTATVTWDFTTAGQAKANASIDLSAYAPLASPTFTGDPKAPTPTFGDNDTSIATTAWVTTALGGFQPLDADLSSIAGYGGTGQWLYRSAANTWSAVTIGTGLSFSGGTLSASGGGGDAFLAGTQTWTGSNTYTSAGVPITIKNTSNATARFDMELYQAASAGATVRISHSRGASIGAQAALIANDFILQLLCLGSDGSAFVNGAQIRAVCESAPSTGHVPAQWQFWTDNGSAFAERTRIYASGGVDFDQSSPADPGAGNIKAANYPAGAWTAWTPTVQSSGGTITSSTVTRARYTRHGKTVTAFFDITVTNAGTGTGFLQISLPVTAAAAGAGMIYGQEVATTLAFIAGSIAPSATLAGMSKYDGTSLVITGYRVQAVAVYEGA